MRYKVIIFFLLIPQLLLAQYTSFNLYPVNPLIINPAFTGVHGRSEVLLNYRQQWLGIEDAPTVSTFLFDKALSPQISLGLQAKRTEQGAIHTNQGNLLFAYRVLLGERSSLNFGLAGGISSTGLSRNSTYNPADPAIQSLPIGDIRPDLRFGTNLYFRGFNLGISFTEMIPNRPFGGILADEADLKFYENYIVNLDYKFDFNSMPFAIQPFGIYYQDKYLGVHYEAGTILHYDDLVYLGGLYRQGYGAGIVAGLHFKDFRLGYGYELASSMVNQIGQGSHEVQLSFRFGKKTTAKKTETPQFAQQNPEPELEPMSPEKPEEKETKKQETREKEVTQDQTPVTLLEEAPEHAVYYSGNHPNELPAGFYVIAGAFDNLENARKNANTYSRDGIFAATGFNSERKLFFVYVYRSDNLEKTKIARGDYRKKAMLKDAWLLEIR